VLDDAHRGALDDHVEALRPRVVAGRQRDVLVDLEVAGLLLARAGAEVHRAVVPDADQRVTWGRPSARTVVSQ
jgi:hypothetical protein